MKKVSVSLDLMVTLRDHHKAIADAINTELKLHDPNTKTAQTKIEYEKILWQQANGKKGPFQAYPAYQQKANEMDPNYKALKAKLLKEGSFQHEGLFYWLFPNNTTIGRKPSKQ